MRKPAAGTIVHVGEVTQGEPQVGDLAFAQVDQNRRVGIMRNHTATHLLHAGLHEILGPHARQAGSLVAPDHLRFDFTHPEPMTRQEILAVEAHVNQAILANYQLRIAQKPLDEAIKEGATALFGEKYEGIVRTIQIGEGELLSYELCGGTHVDETGDIGLFLITYEGSIAAGIRRIEAVTGWQAYQLARQRMNLLDELNAHLGTAPTETLAKVKNLLDTISGLEKENDKLRHQLVGNAFDEVLDHLEHIEGIPVLKAILPDADIDALRDMADKFREKHTSGVIVLASEQNGKPLLIAAVTDDLVKRGLHAGQLVQKVAKVVGGGGGGRPTLAQAGGKETAKLAEALDQVQVYIREALK
jgi:alanyl-tRNA synthetase